jgi:hypothetical protein
MLVADVYLGMVGQWHHGDRLGLGIVGIEVRWIDTEPCSERFDAGAACREFVERAEAGFSSFPRKK